jgi:hypothetical protein
VGLIKEDTGLHCRIAIHDLPDRFNRSIEDPDPTHIAAIRNRADDGEHALFAEGKVPPCMLPYYLLDTVLVPVRAGL